MKDSTVLVLFVLLLAAGLKHETPAVHIRHLEEEHMQMTRAEAPRRLRAPSGPLMPLSVAPPGEEREPLHRKDPR